MTDQYIHEWDNLVAGPHDRVTEGITVASGEGELSRGSILGKVTASGEYRLATTDNADGSEDPVVVLAEDIDATDAAVETVAYLSGEYNEDRVTLGNGLTVDGVREALRDLSIYLKPATEAATPTP